MYEVTHILLFVIVPGILSRDLTLRVKRENVGCVCIPYYQCGDDGVVDPHGSGGIIPRGDELYPICKGVDVCCIIPDDIDENDEVQNMDHHPSNYHPPIQNVPSHDPLPPLPEDHDIYPGSDIDDEGSDIPEPVIPENLQGCGLKRLNPLIAKVDPAIRIIGENDKPENTFYGEFPWMIAVFKVTNGNKNFTCGGSLIKFDVVLTAAHCIHKLTHLEIQVRAGEWDSRTKDEPIPHQDRKVVHVEIHEDFDSGNLRNDIALLFLDESFQQTKTVDTICITPENSFDPVHCQATGWGINSFNERGLFQPLLKKVELPLIDRATCQKKLRTTRLGKYFRLHKSFICAGGQVNQDTCTGDGGGPLVCGNFKGSTYRYAQVGIVSWGIECGRNDPGVYVSVSHLYDWIKNKINIHIEK